MVGIFKAAAQLQVRSRPSAPGPNRIYQKTSKKGKGRFNPRTISITINHLGSSLGIEPSRREETIFFDRR